MMRRPSVRNSSRLGFLLPMILVVIVTLTLGGYIYTETMLLELEATQAFARKAQSKAAADSAAEYVAALLEEPASTECEGFYHRPDLFHGIGVKGNSEDGPNASFSVIVPNLSDSPRFPLRFGLQNESGKLNLNQLLQLDEMIERNYANNFGVEEPLASDEEFKWTAHDRLMQIPGMEASTADAILDWLDADDDVRPYGAESSYYQSLPRPCEPRNGPLESLEELLLVRGVTRDLLYGEDANRNGLLDSGEDKNGDGRLDCGWAAILTASSQESPLRADGRPKIHLNQESLETLYDQIAGYFDEEAARFITAYRMAGSLPEDFEGTETYQTSGQGASKTPVPEKTRGGLDLSLGGNFEIFSIYELIESRVEAEVDGRREVLESPWKTANLPEMLPKLTDFLSISETPPPGRINPFEASRETLQTVPGLSESAIEAVLSLNRIGPDGESYDDISAIETSPGSLLTKGIVDLPTMRRLDHYLTAGGKVFGCQILGTTGNRGPVTRLEILIDATHKPTRFLRYADLTDLGVGYSRNWLAR